MPSGGSGGDQEVTSTSQPWAPQQPYLRSLFERANSQYGMGGPRYYPGQNYATFSPQTNQALKMQRNRAVQGSPVMDSAENLIQNTLQGDFLSPDSNPYLGQYFNQALEQSLPSLNATFSLSGRTGAEAQSQGLADTYGALGRDIYGGAYESERGRQMQSMLFAPQIAANDYQDIQAARDAGNVYDQQRQRVLNARMERYNANQNRPYDNLARYAGLVSGGFGNQATQTQEGGGGSPLMGALGGGMSGAALSAMAPALGPYGIPLAMGGALLGYLGS